MEKPWHDMRASKTLYLEKEDITISLIDPDESKSQVFANLVAHRGSCLVWRALPPGNPDYFVDVNTNGEDLFAYTFSGCRMNINVRNGNITGTTYTK